MKKIILLVVAIFFNTLLIAPATNADPNQPNANAKGYWDLDKMNNAIPIELVIDPKTKTGKIEKLARSTSSTSSTSTSGASWNLGGLPLTATGKVFFKSGAYNYVCSGALVNDAKDDRAIVLTAAHCVYDKDRKSFVEQWIFVPNYDSYPNKTCANIPTGCWPANNLVIRNEFASASSFSSLDALQNDWGFAVIKGNSLLPSFPDYSNNSFNLDILGFSKDSEISYAFGYPAAKPYSGIDLVYAFGPIFSDVSTSSSTWGMNSNMTGGASGGPWLSKFKTDAKSGSLSSVNSYKYTTDKSKMYGPKFNSRTSATLKQAQDADLDNLINYLVL